MSSKVVLCVCTSLNYTLESKGNEKIQALTVSPFVPVECYLDLRLMKQWLVCLTIVLDMNLILGFWTLRRQIVSAHQKYPHQEAGDSRIQNKILFSIGPSSQIDLDDVWHCWTANLSNYLVSLSFLVLLGIEVGPQSQRASALLLNCSQAPLANDICFCFN